MTYLKSAALLLAPTLLLSMGCRGDATGPVAAPVQSRNAPSSRPQPSPGTPVARTAYLDFFRGQVAAACRTARGQEMSKLSSHDCLAYIEKVKPICEQEAIAAMPEVLDKEHEPAARAFINCLLPPAA